MIKKHKGLFITLVSLLALIFLLCVFVLVWFFGDSYKDFQSFKKEFEIPGLDEGAVPQGIGRYGSYFFTTCYMTDGSPTRLYVTKYNTTDGTTDSENYITMKNADESDYTGHAGGVATDGTNVWISSSSTVYVLSYTDVINASKKEGQTATFKDSFKVDCNASFCYYYNNYLYVGEFYRKGNYETAEHHRITTPAGDKNTGVFFCFKTNKSNNRGIESVKPLYAVSITGKIQGMAITSNYIVLSQSYGLADSHILVYDKADISQSAATGKLKVTAGTTTYDDIPLCYLDSSNRVNDYRIPSMSEGLCSNGNTVYVLFENASKKYRAFTREKTENVYSFTPAAKEA